MLTQKNLFLLMLSSFFVCCSQSEQSYSCWNSSMDSLLVNYLCSGQSSCESKYGHSEDVVYGENAQRINCLVDSLIKKVGLSYNEYYLIENIPDSVFMLSEQALKRIEETKDSCLRELGMVALSEKGTIQYEFKNVCHIKKFDGVKKISARELADYWLFDYEKELSDSEIKKMEKETEDFIAESMNQNNIKESFKIGYCTGDIVGTYSEPFFGGLEVAMEVSMDHPCLIRQNLWPYYISKSMDTIYFKISPPTNLLYADGRDSRSYSTFNEKSKLGVIPKSGKAVLHLPWVPQRTPHFFKESTFSPFSRVEKGDVLVVDIPCFDEAFTKNFYAFHITETKYPYLHCIIGPANIAIEKN